MGTKRKFTLKMSNQLKWTLLPLSFSGKKGSSAQPEMQNMSCDQAHTRSGMGIH